MRVRHWGLLCWGRRVAPLQRCCLRAEPRRWAPFCPTLRMPAWSPPMPSAAGHPTYCLKLKRGVVTQPRASGTRRCLLASEELPGGGTGTAKSVTLSSVSRGRRFTWMGKQILQDSSQRLSRAGDGHCQHPMALVSPLPWDAKRALGESGPTDAFADGAGGATCPTEVPCHGQTPHGRWVWGEPERSLSWEGDRGAGGLPQRAPTAH